MSFDWKNRRVLVTGGRGFIGSHLVLALRELGANVRSWDKEDGDLTGFPPAIAACRRQEIVFHLAARVAGIRTYETKPYTIADHNLIVDSNVIHAATHSGVRYFFYASSSHVDTDLSYGWVKQTGEKLLQWHAQEFGGLRISIARICGAYGPGQNIDLDTGSLIPVLCHRAAKWPAVPFKLLTDGNEIRSYIYVADVVRKIIQSVEHLRHGEQHFSASLITSGIGSSVRQIAEAIVYLSGKPIDIEYGEKAASVAYQVPPEFPKGPRTDLATGLKACYDDVCRRLEGVPVGV